MTPDVNVVVMDFKTSKGKEMVIPNEDGSYTILINARLSYDGQLKAYQHAMRHIEDNDFEKDNVQQIEYVAHSSTMTMDFTSGVRMDFMQKPTPIPAKDFEEKIKSLQAERRRLQRRIKRDQERVNFITEHCDLFAREEHHYLYGNDL